MESVRKPESEIGAMPMRRKALRTLLHTRGLLMLRII
jgi:hypothetical protein